MGMSMDAQWGGRKDASGVEALVDVVEFRAAPQLTVEISSLHNMVDQLGNTVQDLFGRLSILTQDEEVSVPMDEPAIEKSGFPVSPAIQELQTIRRDLVALNSAIQHRMSLLDI